jgi:DNA-binding Lrp family transcriptional regulator
MIRCNVAKYLDSQNPASLKFNILREVRGGKERFFVEFFRKKRFLGIYYGKETVIECVRRLEDDDYWRVVYFSSVKDAEDYMKDFVCDYSLMKEGTLLFNE